MHEYDKAVDCFEAQHTMATSLKLPHMQSDAAMNMGGHPHWSGQLVKALLLSLTKLMDGMVTRQHWHAWMVCSVMGI